MYLLKTQENVDKFVDKLVEKPCLYLVDLRNEQKGIHRSLLKTLLFVEKSVDNPVKNLVD